MTLINKSQSKPYKEYEEKRDFIRMKVDTPVSLLSDANPDTINGICKNLSGGGLLVEADATLPVGAKVEVCIRSNHGHSPMLKARAAVTRVEAELGEQQASCCRIGMAITEML